MISKPNPSSAVPIYVQLMEQVKHAIETSAVKPGEQLPTIRGLAESLAINPNTISKAYRELEHEGLIELRHGSGAFAVEQADVMVRSERLQEAQRAVKVTVKTLIKSGLKEDQIRRLVEAELDRLRLDTTTYQQTRE